jgi:hypothetical protein
MPSTPTPNVDAALGRYSVALRPRSGTLPRRFSTRRRSPAGLAPGLYSTLGLSTIQISLLTGYTASNVHDVLRRHQSSAGPAADRRGASAPSCERP